MVEEEEYEVELPVLPPAVRGEEMGLLPGPPPDDRSPMQQAIIDGAKPVEGNEFAFQTNEGTVFIASPADMARSSMMDSVMSAKWARSYKPTNAEIDRLMKQDRD